MHTNMPKSMETPQISFWQQIEKAYKNQLQPSRRQRFSTCAQSTVICLVFARTGGREP